MPKHCNKCRLELTPLNSIKDTGPKASRDGVKSICRECNATECRQRREERKARDVGSAVGYLLGGARPTPVAPTFNVRSPRASPLRSTPLRQSEPPVLDTPHAPPARGAPVFETVKPSSGSRLLTQPGTSATLERFVIIPDVHHPEAHDDYRVMLRAMDVFQPEGIVVLGDFADAESLSAHPKTQKGAEDFKSEVDAVMAELDILDRLPRVKWKKYIEGNHEYRLQRYLANNAQALMGMLDIKSCFHLIERGWDFTPYMKPTRVGKIHFTHDTGQAGQNAHRSAQMIFMGSAVIGHTHRMAYEVRGVWDGLPVVSAMFGWLGNPEKVTYIHQAGAAMWPRGFGLGYHDLSTGLVYMVPVPIVNGTCVVEGVLVK